MSSGLYGFNDSGRLSSKAGALEFAIMMNTNRDVEDRVAIDYKKAQRLFDFICKNVKLPDVPVSSTDALLEGYNGLLGAIMSHLDKKTNEKEVKEG